LFYTSRAISEQASKGNRKDWAYNLTEVYLIAFLEDFNLPGNSKTKYLQDICLVDKATGKIFYDKLSLMFITMLNFVKEPHELDTKLDKWLYALKHLIEFKQRPDFLSEAEFDELFNLAKYANLTREERNMYNASLKHKWDNKNVRDYERNKAREEGKREEILKMVFKLKAKSISTDEIAELTGLSVEEIEAML
jgi:predicted transposase/invertase (TIGR01784 family)